MNQYLEFISNHYLLSLAWVVVLYLLIQDLIENSFNKYKGLSPLLAVTKMNSSESVKVIDVREIHEYIKGHIEDSLNIPLSKLDDQLPELEGLKSQPVIVVCHTGTRSIPACKTLIKAGFQDVYNITGGMQSWEDNKLPIQITSKNKS
jgi:rhodanese-related sulfurtransferase